MRVLIIIPAFNESENICELAREIEALDYDYIIINDCSTDLTAKILDDNNLNHIDLPINLGLAAVTQVGFNYANDKNYDCAIVIDGDGQHPPKYIEKVVLKITEGYDYVIGSRFLEKKKNWSMRMIGSRLISFAIRLKTRRRFTDPTSGMRATGRNTLMEFSKSMNFIAEPDALTYLLKKKLRVCEVQVDMNERDEGESYFSNPFKSIKFMFNILMSIIFIQ
ncbi:MAG: glycosyltransferase family 2 protein [Anaerorhabdus sp.]|uniref:glycosyltransferase family 2 protein n=1 Tax=Anaerorhabdus sp. TaxID=1872524 RepID=UPI002FC6BCBF